MDHDMCQWCGYVQKHITHSIGPKFLRLACVIGASVICVDLVIQRIPGKQNFRIQDSNGFLAGALSLSFGIMLFSALNNMLPEAQEYLSNGGLSKAAAAWVTICCFLGGVLGIQFVSRIMHHYIPSHVVDCDHTHDEEDPHDREHDDKGLADHRPGEQNGTLSEETPLLSNPVADSERSVSHPPRRQQAIGVDHDTPKIAGPIARRPSLQPRLTARMSTFMGGAKVPCDEGGPCYGYGDPCGTECFKVFNRTSTRAFGRFQNAGLHRQASLLRTATIPRLKSRSADARHSNGESAQMQRPPIGPSGWSTQALHGSRSGMLEPPAPHTKAPHRADQQANEGGQTHTEESHSLAESSTANSNDASHHHHVPSNAFMAIGLQTSIAIALHKLPEGFITYATNHANPSLGFSVFMALFIHNITEGFAMALPLYLAINNRIKAMFWSSLLGGVSQPLGAGIAAVWFQLAGSGGAKPGDTVYGCMFSITAGIMASVALQLFSESQMLTHSRTICTVFAFTGMGILGVSHALTA